MFLLFLNMHNWKGVIYEVHQCVYGIKGLTSGEIYMQIYNCVSKLGFPVPVQPY